MLATPGERGSGETASRNARANALNCASTTWCASGAVPGRAARNTVTCKVIRAAWPSDSQTWRVS